MVNMSKDGGGAQDVSSAVSNRFEIDVQARIEEAAAMTAEMTSQAEAQAGEILEAAQEEAERIRVTAREEGHREGFGSGREEALAESAKERKEESRKVGKLIKDIGKARDTMLGELEDEIIDLILATSRKIVCTAIDKDDAVFESIIKNALRQIKWEGKITLRVSSKDYERFFSEGSASFVVGDETISVSVVEDKALENGACHIESEGETVDAGVDSQIKHISIAFHGVGGESPLTDSAIGRGDGG